MGVLSSGVKQLVLEDKTFSPFIAEVLNVWSFTFMSFLCLCCMVVEHSLN
jgi:hypothetical protein